MAESDFHISTPDALTVEFNSTAPLSYKLFPAFHLTVNSYPKP